jgi:hypothetical protein
VRNSVDNAGDNSAIGRPESRPWLASRRKANSRGVASSQRGRTSRPVSPDSNFKQQTTLLTRDNGARGQRRPSAAVLYVKNADAKRRLWRLRGGKDAGRDENSATTTKRHRRGPRHRPLSALAGADKRNRSRGATSRPSLAKLFPRTGLPIKKGAERRKAQSWSHATQSDVAIRLRFGRGRAPHRRMLPSASASGARASRRSTAALATQINAMAQPRPCFLRLACGGR